MNMNPAGPLGTRAASLVSVNTVQLSRRRASGVIHCQRKLCGHEHFPEKEKGDRESVIFSPTSQWGNVSLCEE